VKPCSRRNIGTTRVRLDCSLGVLGGVRRLAGASAAGALLLAPAIASAVPTLGPIAVRYAYFSPNGDGIQDSTAVTFTPGGAVDSVTVEVTVVAVAGGGLVATPIPAALFPSGVPVTANWNPGAITDGEYQFDVTVVEGTDSVQDSARVEVDTATPGLVLGAVGPSPFDPEGEAPYHELIVPFTTSTTDSTTATVAVMSQGGVTTDALGSFPGPGSNDFVWTGIGASGAPFNAGTYDLRVTAADLAGNTVSVLRTVILDRSGPIVVAAADSLQITSFPFSVSGTATDVADRVTSVQYSFDGAPFVSVDSLGAPASFVNWSTLVPGAPEPGVFVLQLRAFDDVPGHVGTDSVVVAYDLFLPVPVDSRLVGGGPIRDGDLVEIETEWNAPGLAISATFQDIDSNFSGTNTATVIDHGDGSYLIRHRVSPTSTVIGGPKNLRIIGRFGALAGVDTLRVTLEDRLRGQELFVDRNRFDPHTGDVVTIAANGPTVALDVNVHDLSGALVRGLLGSGFVRWDGRNDHGKVVASGVYFLSIDAGGTTMVRKVAVTPGGAP